MSRLEVACAAEGADYVEHTAAMLHSLLARPEAAGARIHLLHGPRASRRRLSRLGPWVAELGGELVLHRVDDPRLAPLPSRGFTGAATWYRILLPELLGDIARVLYLDSDVLVADDVSALWATELGGALVGAVTNVFEPWNLKRPAQLGLPGPEAYFNAGVLLLDLEAMRAAGATAEMLRVGAARATELTWRDQDLLNLVLGARRHPLHPRWNAMNSLWAPEWADPVFGAAVVREARERPAIRHFEGPGANKPWHAGCERPGAEAYVAHRAATPWPRVRRTGGAVERLRARRRR